MKNIFVTGGCGYKGHVLVPKLLDAGHKVTVFDALWFDNKLEANTNLTVIQGDIREIKSVDLKGYDSIIHLASVANDPCSDLNPLMNWEISGLATMQLIEAAVRSNVAQFLYASSGSVYGVKEEPFVTEELELHPLSEYNKTKMVAERILLSYADKIAVQIVRPATVCGYSRRMRLDVAVNLLTMQALSKGVMTVLGGTQIRPNIHIDEIANVYLFLLDRPHVKGIFNAGFENLSILEIAEKIKVKIPSEITILESNDPRSYRLDSSKLLNLGFKISKNVDHAIDEIIRRYNLNELSDDTINYNLKWMIESKIA
jgi:nucleoside-diphosphate-sugar epimerase